VVVSGSMVVVVARAGVVVVGDVVLVVAGGAASMVVVGAVSAAQTDGASRMHPRTRARPQPVVMAGQTPPLCAPLVVAPAQRSRHWARRDAAPAGVASSGQRTARTRSLATDTENLSGD